MRLASWFRSRGAVPRSFGIFVEPGFVGGHRPGPRRHVAARRGPGHTGCGRLRPRRHHVAARRPAGDRGVHGSERTGDRHCPVRHREGSLPRRVPPQPRIPDRRHAPRDPVAGVRGRRLRGRRPEHTVVAAGRRRHQPRRAESLLAHGRRVPRRRWWGGVRGPGRGRPGERAGVLGIPRPRQPAGRGAGVTGGHRTGEGDPDGDTTLRPRHRVRTPALRVPEHQPEGRATSPPTTCDASARRSPPTSHPAAAVCRFASPTLG